jgi:hypothetical protein
MQKPEMQPSLPWECLSKSEWNVARSSSKLNQFTPVNSTFPDGGGMCPPISVVVPPLCGEFMWATRDSALWNRASALSISRELRRQEFYKFKPSHPLFNTNKNRRQSSLDTILLRKHFSFHKHLLHVTYHCESQSQTSSHLRLAFMSHGAFRG